MAVYNQGSLSLLCGTSQIVGSDTAFRANVSPGQLMSIPGLPFVYQVGQVVDDFTLIIVGVIPGPIGNTVSGMTYSIVSDFTPSLSLPMPGKHHRNVQAMINRALKILDLEIPAGIVTVVTNGDELDFSNPANGGYHLLGWI